MTPPRDPAAEAHDDAVRKAAQSLRHIPQEAFCMENDDMVRAKTVVRAYLAAMAKAGFKLTHREPTEEQERAAEAADTEYTVRNFGTERPLVHQSGYDHWLFMHAAAPPMPPLNHESA